LQTGQISGGLISTTVLPQWLHFQVFSGMFCLLSVIAVFPPHETTMLQVKRSGIITLNDLAGEAERDYAHDFIQNKS